MSPITTHILDINKGKPAKDVEISLEFKQGESWEKVGSGKTDADGRLKTLQSKDNFKAGVYRINFDTQSYFNSINEKTFYPEASIVFIVENIDEHFHVPLLLTAYGYSTYRGS